MGEALAIIIAFAALLGISWGVTCAAGTAAWIALLLVGSFCSNSKK